MPQHWVIAPVQANPPEQFDKVWQFDLANNIITIGWSKLGDISDMSREDLAELVAQTYPERTVRAQGLLVNMLWNFYHEISVGDLVIARRGRNVLAAVGEVAQPAAYSPGRNPHINHPNVLGVSWRDTPRDMDFGGIVFPMRTVTSISEEQFHNRLGVGEPPENGGGPEGVENRQEFVLEKYLEDFIVTNFSTIKHFNGLKIYEEDGDLAQQYETNVGRIDILAQETNPPSSFVVIELKKGRPADKVVGQILRYMGWVQENLCKKEEGQSVRGLVICRESDPGLTYALKMINDVDVRYYKISFELHESPME